MLTYDEAISYVHSALVFGIKPGLTRVEAVLKELGNPHEKLKFAHIAGTNGKGSTTATTAAILRAAGYKVGMFISPYLEFFEERMQVNGEMISREELSHCVTAVKEAAERSGVEPSEFEIVTATAMLFFERQGCDIVVLEVGLGGRFDATNIIPCPEVAVITSISLDHTNILGETYEEIAMEKCGIIKEAGAVVRYPEQQESARLVIERRVNEECGYLKTPDLKELFPKKESIEGSEFVYKGMRLKTKLVGEHQLKNIITAIEAAFMLSLRGFNITEEHIKEGVTNVTFSGRFEVVSKEPLIVLDGGHNEDGVRVLRSATLRHIRTRRGRLIVVMGMLNGKNHTKSIPMIAALADMFIAASPDNPRALAVEEIANAADPCPMVKKAESVKSAIDMALSHAKAEDSILICGSLYLVGEARTYIRNLELGIISPRSEV